MSYQVVRIVTCDIQGCETPSPYALQGEDDQAEKDGWKEFQHASGRKFHICPICHAAGKGIGDLPFLIVADHDFPPGSQRPERPE